MLKSIGFNNQIYTGKMSPDGKGMSGEIAWEQEPGKAAAGWWAVRGK